jgi:hypothetical protein
LPSKPPGRSIVEANPAARTASSTARWLSPIRFGPLSSTEDDDSTTTCSTPASVAAATNASTPDGSA